jgi:hypothetical protein
MDESSSGNGFLEGLKLYYDEWLKSIDDEFSGEEHTFSPEFLRKMEELIYGGKEPPSPSGQ